MISIIVPVYNKREYLNYAVQSILLQDYKDYEIILVNDGSTDGSEALCEQYKKELKKIKVLHQMNRGVSAARNIGMDAAEGEYILFLDADDLLGKDCLIRCSDILKKEQVDFIQFGKRIYREEEDVKMADEGTCRILSGQDALKLFYKRKDITPLVWGCIYKKELISDLKFDETLHLGEDTLFKFKAIKKSKAVGLTSMALYLNRMVDNTLSRKRIDASDLISIITAMKSIKQSGMNITKEAKIRNNYLFHRYYSYFNQVVMTNDCLEKEPVFSKLTNELTTLNLDCKDVQVILKKALFLLYKKDPFIYRNLMKSLKK